METIKYKTSSPAGDLISLLPSIRQLYRQSGKKAIIYQAVGILGQGLPGYDQAFTNEHGESIMMAEQTFKNLIPLLKAQEYIEDYLEFKGQQVNYDMDEIRLKTFVNQPLGSINRWSFYVFPEMACDLSEKWIEAEKIFMSIRLEGYEATGKNVAFYGDKVIINYTNRYRNNWINYFFLKEYQDRILFAGLPKELEEFNKKWELEIKPLYFTDFKDLAKIINSCQFYMGNANMIFQIAEGLKIPRLLETFQVMPNVIPMGKNGYDFYHQTALEFYFNKLINQ